MKLSSDEGRAVAFMLGLIGLAVVARIATRPGATDIPAVAQIDAAALEDSSEGALKAGRARVKALGADEQIDVNSASAQELDRLPGVGPGLAARIVESRESDGAFDSAADLRAVRGVGPALLARLEPHLAFGPRAGLARRNSGLQSRTAGADTPGVRARRLRGSEQTATEPLDLNTATATQLEALPGVGPALAARIIAKRDSLNGFEKTEDLRRVRGIGPATLEKLRPFFRS